MYASMLRALIPLCRTEVHHHQNWPGFCREDVHSGSIYALLYGLPVPCPGDILNWPQCSCPLPGPPVPVVGMDCAIPGIDFAVQPRGHPVGIVFSEAHIVLGLVSRYS